MDSTGAEVPEDLIVIVYAPPLAGDLNRVLAAVHAFERAFPGVRLAWKVTEEGLPVALPQRDEWLAAETSDGKIPLLCNGDETYPVTIWGLETSGFCAPGRRPQLELHASLPLDEKGSAAAADVLEGIADGAHAL